MKRESVLVSLEMRRVALWMDEISSGVLGETFQLAHDWLKMGRLAVNLVIAAYKKVLRVGVVG